METENQWIDGWSVAGDDRVVGTVHGRAGQASGRTIITSPVVQVRFMGEWKTPVAFTESGSAYWLRDPAARYGLDAAEAFVWRLSRTQRPPQPMPARDYEHTIILQPLEGISRHNRERV